MDSSNVPATVDNKGGLGNFLTNKEKMGGTIATLAILSAAGAGLYIALPVLINFVGMLTTLVGKLMVLGGMALFVALFVYIATQPRTWTLLDYSFVILARKATYFIIKRDPIAFLEAYAKEYLQKKCRQFQNSLQIVRQKYNEQKKHAEEKNEEYQDTLEAIKAIKKRSYNEAAGTWKNEMDHQQFILESQKLTMLSETLKKRASRIKVLE